MRINLLKFICPKCDKYKLSRQFRRNRPPTSGCLSCKKQQDKNNYQKNKEHIKLIASKYYYTNHKDIRDKYKLKYKEKRLFINSLKENKNCLDCGEKFPIICMDWDHVRDKKIFNLCQIHSSLSFIKYKKMVLAEIEKCELICSNCHRIRTKKRMLVENIINLKTHPNTIKRYRDDLNWLNTDYKNKPCLDCKKYFPPEAMDWDHLFNKKTNISQMIGRVPRDIVVEEIKKCELVCSNCHRIRTDRLFYKNNMYQIKKWENYYV